MKTIERQLCDYIDAQKKGEHITPKGITICSPDDDWLKAEFNWVDTEETLFQIGFFCPMKDFVTLLDIKKMSDIDTIEPGRLMELYYEGLAEMLCYVTLEYFYGMTFKKLGNKIVVENERGIKHTIPLFEKPETPDQYIAYATEYYKLMECNGN